MAMNFSENTRTGRLAEIATESLFTSWGWIVGYDKIDEGYDLNIEPSRDRYDGARFLVQVKGTARSKGKTVVAPVSKKRLRQYLVNPIPTFIVRSTADGSLYWIHAQSWARANEHKLAGDGSSGVAIPKANVLIDRNGFEKFLASVLEPPARRQGALAELAEARGRYLSSLDARLGVRTSVKDGNEQHEIYATSEEVEAKFQFQPNPDPENINALRDALEFGLPGNIQVKAFRLSGSPLFEAIGASQNFDGTLSMQSKDKKTGVINIQPGNKYSISAPEMSLNANMFKGTKGTAISNMEFENIFNIDAKFIREGEQGRADFTLGFREGALSGSPLREIQHLSTLATWAQAVIDSNHILFELVFPAGRITFSESESGLAPLETFLPYAVVVGRLHLVARALGSNFVLPEDYDFTPADLRDIALVFSLLKGERRRVRVGPMEFEKQDPAALKIDGQFFVSTTMSFSIGGQFLGEVPVQIDLSGFISEDLPTPGMARLSAGESGEAWISYAEHRSDPTAPA